MFKRRTSAKSTWTMKEKFPLSAIKNFLAGAGRQPFCKGPSKHPLNPPNKPRQIAKDSDLSFSFYLWIWKFPMLNSTRVSPSPRGGTGSPRLTAIRLATVPSFNGTAKKKWLTTQSLHLWPLQHPPAVMWSGARQPAVYLFHLSNSLAIHLTKR